MILPKEEIDEMAWVNWVWGENRGSGDRNIRDQDSWEEDRGIG